MYQFIKICLFILPCTVLTMHESALAATDSAATAAPVAPPTESTLKIGLLQDFDTLNPLLSSMLSSTYIYNMVARKFVTLDDKMNWVPQMAEEIPQFSKKSAEIIVVDGQKKVRAHWKIKKDATWGDGTPVTCLDVKFSKQIGSDSNIAVANRDQYDAISEVQCDPKNPKTATLTYSSDRWDFFKSYQFYILPAHLEQAIYEKFKGQKEGYEKNSLYSKDPTNPGLYNGPFLLSELKPGSHVILKNNEKFYGTKPSFQKILVKIIPQSNTLEALLATHEIDLVANVALNLDQSLLLDKKIKNENWAFEARYTPALIYEHIDFNLDNEFLKDPKIREALNIGLDKELLVKSLFEDKQQVASHFISPRDPWSSALKIKNKSQFNRKNAQEILNALGWTLDAQSGFRFKDGKKLSLVLSTTAGNKLRETVAAFIQDQFKQLGVEVLIKNLPPRVFFGELMKNRKFEGMAMYAWTFLPENPPGVFYHSKNIPSDKNAFAGRNYMGWNNSSVNDAAEALEAENNPKKRTQLIQKIVEGYMKDHPTIPLYYRVDTSIAPKRLAGYAPTGHQQQETNFIENWSFSR